MWHDIKTNGDYLNIGVLVESVYDSIVGRYDKVPLSFGIK